MPLLAHLRELRSRLFRASLAILACTIVAFFFYESYLFDFVVEPFDSIREQYGNATLNFQDIGGPFNYAIKICLMAGLLAASPVWLYQLWAFVTPGLHRNERRWAMAFLAVSVPLFLGGAALAYMFLPKGFGLLIGFNPDPEKVANIIGFDAYLTFVMRMMMVFSVSFVAPVFLVALNLVGVVNARTLLRIWRPVTMGVFVFAAVATPSGDPVTLTVLVVPLMLLYFAATGVCAINDRRRRTAGIDGLDYSDLDDDAASPLDDVASRPAKPRPAAKPSDRYEDDWT
jgi:sec-independent protein translocase protein TatC